MADNWKRIGQTAIVELWEAKPSVLVVVPFPGAEDDADTAHSCLDVLAHHLRRQQSRAHVILLPDDYYRQSGAARRVYYHHADPVHFSGIALVAPGRLTRVALRFDLSLTRPVIPVGVFPDLNAAQAWAAHSPR